MVKWLNTTAQEGSQETEICVVFVLVFSMKGSGYTKAGKLGISYWSNWASGASSGEFV